jgi:hypothetical protein
VKEAPGPESIGAFAYAGRQYEYSVMGCIAPSKAVK